MGGYINSFSDYILLNETLKSDKIDIAVKKLDMFFTKNGLHRRYIFGDDVNSPYYQIFTDKLMMDKILIDYKDKNDSSTKRLIKSGVDVDKIRQCSRGM